jgi:predicted nucleic acid-binding protein
VNGLGLPVSRVAAELIRLKSIFPLLSDTASIFGEWERLVTAHQVVGKHAHDARIVAAMKLHGISHLLTFNKGDFSRYPGVTALDPVAIAPPVSPSP